MESIHVLFTHQTNGKWHPHDINLTLTLNEQVVETLVGNDPIQDYTHSDDHIHLRSAEMLIHLRPASHIPSENCRAGPR